MGIGDRIMESLASSTSPFPSFGASGAVSDTTKGTARRAFCNMGMKCRIMESLAKKSLSRKIILSLSAVDDAKGSEWRAFCKMVIQCDRVMESHATDNSLSGRRMLPFPNFGACLLSGTKRSERRAFCTMGTENQIFEPLQDLEFSTPSIFDGRDPTFVLEPQFRPTMKHIDFVEPLGDQIPCIDLSPIHQKNAEGLKKLIKEVDKAAQEWGFFEVVNHGVPLSLIDTLEKEALAFFSLPLDGKSKILRTSERPFGYFYQELTKGRRDWKEVFDFLVKEGVSFSSADGSLDLHSITSQWPEEPIGLRDACQQYARATEKLGFELLGLLSQSLGLGPEYFHKHFSNQTSSIRVNHYPPCPIPDLVLGVGGHRDPTALTILAQDEVGGLQVRRKDGEWIGVKPRGNAFVINLGDQFQVWTNKKYRSIEHRVVVNQNYARLSCAVFMGPGITTDVYPLPELLQSQPPKYSRYNYGHFISRRMAGNIQQLERTFQIDDYEIN